MLKYFCDKCGNEIKTSVITTIPMYAYDNFGATIWCIGNKHLCEKCVKEFEKIKDQLQHKEDFFNN